MFLVNGSPLNNMARRVLTVVLVCCLCTSMVGIVVADSESFRAANAIETPEETPASGTTINHIGVFDQGEQIEATITGPEETYEIGLFDSSDTEIANQPEVSDTVTFDSDDLSPGSYFLSVTDVPFEYVAPIVISGYDVAVDLNENTAADELTIEATVTETALQGAPHKVEAVVWNDDRETRTELTADGEFSSSGEYESTISIDDFGGEPYNVYVVAVSENEIQGENEILAIGEASGGDQDDDSNGTDNGSDDTGDDSDDSDETDDSSDDESDDFDDGDDTDESTDDQNDSDPDAGDDDVNDDSSVIEPNTSAGGDDTTGTDDSTQTDDDSIDEVDDETPLSIVLPVVALLLASLGITRLK